jgi:3'-5' exoribonuclease
MTKNGKPYDNVVLQDKTGVIDGKIWDPNSMGINDFEPLDYIDITGEVTTFNGTRQLNIKGVRVADEGEYIPSDYLPSSTKNIDAMYDELLKLADSVGNKYLNLLLKAFFVEDKEFINKFKKHSAAKTIHHSFIGGLLEHTLSVTNMCDYFAKAYPVLNRDLLITAAMLHDIGKVNELSSFPQNDYTDQGKLLGHIVVGYEMICKKIDTIEGFPEKLAREIKHCVLAHHGELEYGSPKKPALPEAFAINLADNADAKLETISELLLNTRPQDGSEWYGFNKALDSNIRKADLNYGYKS